MRPRSVAFGGFVLCCFSACSATAIPTASGARGSLVVEDAATVLRPGVLHKSLSELEQDLKLELKQQREKVALEEAQLKEIQSQEEREDRNHGFRPGPPNGPSLVRKETKPPRRSEPSVIPPALTLAAASAAAFGNEETEAALTQRSAAAALSRQSLPPSTVALGDTDGDQPSVEATREGGGMQESLGDSPVMQRHHSNARQVRSPQLPSLRDDDTAKPAVAETQKSQANSQRGSGLATKTSPHYEIVYDSPAAARDATVSSHYPVDTLGTSDVADPDDSAEPTDFDDNASNASGNGTDGNDTNTSNSSCGNASISGNQSSPLPPLPGSKDEKGSASSRPPHSPPGNHREEGGSKDEDKEGNGAGGKGRGGGGGNHTAPENERPTGSNITDESGRNDTNGSSPMPKHRGHPKGLQVEIPMHSVSVEQSTAFVKELAAMERDKLCPKLNRSVAFEVSAAHAGISSSLNVALQLYFPSTDSYLVVTVLWAPTANPLTEAEDALSAAREDLLTADKWTGMVETGAKMITPTEVCDWPPPSNASMVESHPARATSESTSSAILPPLGLLVEEELDFYHAGLKEQAAQVESKDEALLEEARWRDELSELPASFDWREQSPTCLDYIHDQGTCGTSYIFAAVDSLSDRVCVGVIGSARPRRMSPMRPALCEDSRAGCHGGGSSKTALAYIAQHGSVPEVDWPYSTACFDSSQCSSDSGPVGGCQTDISYKAKCADFFSVAQIEQIENWNDAAAAALLNCEKLERANVCKSFVRNAFKGGSLKFVASPSFCLLLSEKWVEFSVEASTTSTSTHPAHTASHTTSTSSKASSKDKRGHTTSTSTTTPFKTTGGASLLEMQIGEYALSDQSRLGRFETGRSSSRQSWDWWWWWPWSSNDTSSTTTTTDVVGPLGGFDLNSSTTTSFSATPVLEAYGFHLGERVLWAGSDDDVPTGSVGTITNFTLGKVVVHFPAGTWGFDAKDLTAASAADFLDRVCDVQRCSMEEPQSSYGVARSVMVVNHVETFKSELYNRGPFYTSFHVYEDFTWFFSMWPSEAYTRQWGVRLGGHAAVLIGWEANCTYHTYVALLLQVDDRSSKPKGNRKNSSSIHTPESSDGLSQAECWVLRNSWGEDWGDRGHFRMKSDMLTGPDEVSIHIASVAPEPVELNHTTGSHSSTTAVPWSIKKR